MITHYKHLVSVGAAESLNVLIRANQNETTAALMTVINDWFVLQTLEDQAQFGRFLKANFLRLPKRKFSQVWTQVFNETSYHAPLKIMLVYNLPREQRPTTLKP